MNYSEVILQSPGRDRADKSSSCSVHAKESDFLSLSLACFLLTSFFPLSTAACWATSTKIYELKLELSIPLPTPSLCHPPCGSAEWSLDFRGKQTGHCSYAYLPALAGQTPVQAGRKNPLKREALKTMYTVSMCKHPFRGLPWDDEGAQLGPEKKRGGSTRWPRISIISWFKKLTSTAKCALQHVINVFEGPKTFQTKMKERQRRRSREGVVIKQLFHLCIPVGKSGEKLLL